MPSMIGRRDISGGFSSPGGVDTDHVSNAKIGVALGCYADSICHVSLDVPGNSTRGGGLSRRRGAAALLYDSWVSSGTFDQNRQLC